MPSLNNLAPELKPQPPYCDVFRERCEARALLYAAGELTLHAAVDQLQHDAEHNGLPDSIGQDAVQAVMAQAFATVRPELTAPPEPPEQRQWQDFLDFHLQEPDLPEPADVAASTLEAADHLRRHGKPEQLRAWLAGLSETERAAIRRHWEQTNACDRR